MHSLNGVFWWMKAQNFNIVQFINFLWGFFYNMFKKNFAFVKAVKMFWKIESEVAQLCPTLCDPIDYSLPSVGFSRQEYWSGLPFPSPGDLPDTRIQPRSPSLQADSLSSEPLGNPKKIFYKNPYFSGNSLMVQWLRLCSPDTGGLGLIPGQETRSHVSQLRPNAAKKKTKKKKIKNLYFSAFHIYICNPLRINAYI